ncbi:MAG: hypothetical protein P8074_08780 [Anaerolineales bacterium]|jgi:hypothetical protein
MNELTPGTTGMFSLRFNIELIPVWAERYDASYDTFILEQVVPKVKARKYFNRKEFLDICRWKAPRPRRVVEENSDNFVQAVTYTALTTSNERLRIRVLTLMRGVSWPTASVLLHFCHEQPYPILDYRSLWTLRREVPNRYTFNFWQEYVAYCRQLIGKAKVSMRTLNRALWQYAKVNQKKHPLDNVFMLGSGH